jgi:hypothetical protein
MKKHNPLLEKIGTLLLAPIIIGIVLLFLEYKTDIFQNDSSQVETATIFPTSTSQLITSTQTPIPTENKLSAFFQIEEITILGNDSDGFNWYAPSDGTFQFKYSGGAYSPWASDVECSPVGENLCWKTAIYIYNNCDVKWIRESGDDLDKPGNFDFLVGITSTKKTVEEAESISKSSNDIQLNLSANSCVTFIALDGVDKLNNSGWSAYTDNRGDVKINISILSSQ